MSETQEQPRLESETILEAGEQQPLVAQTSQKPVDPYTLSWLYHFEKALVYSFAYILTITIVSLSFPPEWRPAQSVIQVINVSYLFLVSTFLWVCGKMEY